MLKFLVSVNMRVDVFGYIKDEAFVGVDFDVILSPFELRMRYIKTTMPYYTEMGHSSLNP